MTIPTLGGVLLDIQKLGEDRASLVREPGPAIEAGLVIYMLTAKAVRELGPLCVEAAQKLCDGTESDKPWMAIDHDTRVKEVFEKMEKEKKRFVWFGTTDHPPLVAIFLSQEISEWLAPRLSAKGCPTSLV